VPIGQQHERARAAPRAPARLAQREGVHVVVHHGGRPGGLGEKARHRHARELGHVMGLAAHPARSHVHESGQSRAHAREATLARQRKPRDLGGEGEEPLQGGAAARPVRGLTSRDEHAPVGRHQSRGGGGAAHIHAEEQALRPIRVSHRRYPAST
jgi:hypothetical protein